MAEESKVIRVPAAMMKRVHDMQKQNAQYLDLLFADTPHLKPRDQDSEVDMIYNAVLYYQGHMNDYLRTHAKKTPPKKR